MLYILGKNKKNTDLFLKKSQVKRIFRAMGKSEWIREIRQGGSAIEVQQSLSSTKTVHIHELAAWVRLQDRYEQLIDFMDQFYEGYTMRERQHSKVRFEIPRLHPVDHTLRRLSDMFSLMEEFKDDLFIEEYSISQTSLEQIFNFFASQQEEEKGGPGRGLAKTAHKWRQEHQEKSHLKIVLVKKLFQGIQQRIVSRLN